MELSKKQFCIGGAVNDLPRRRPSQLLVGLGISGEQHSGRFRQIPSGKLSQLRLNVSRSYVSHLSSTGMKCDIWNQQGNKRKPQ